MYTLKDLLVDCSAGVGATGPLEDYATVWRAMTKAVQEAIHAGKGINISQLGRFTVVKNSLRESPGIKGKVFVLSDTFQRNHGALFKKPGLGLLAPCSDLNLAKLCVITQLDKDTAQGLISHLIQTLGRAIGKGQSVRVTFGHVGVLVAEDHRVSLNFFTEDSIHENTSVTCSARGERPTIPASLESARQPESRAQTSTSNTNNSGRGKESGSAASARQAKPAATPATAPATNGANPSSARKKTMPQVPPLAVHRSNPPSTRSNKAEEPIKTGLRNEASSRVTVSNLLKQDAEKDKDKASSALTEENVRHLPNGVDVDLTNIKPVSLFPTKAVGTGPATGRSHREGNVAYQRTMMDAYHRLEERLAKQVTDDERAMRMIKEREAMVDEMHQREKMTRKQKQEEWRDYLSRQAEEQMKLRKEEHYRDFLAPPPEQVTAYPQNGMYNRSKKTEIEKSLRQTLEEQIKAKEEKKKNEKEQSFHADLQLIQWVRDQEQQERNNRLAKRIMERESLFREWNIQRAHLAEVKRLGPGKIH